jgi:phage-related protein
MADYVMVPIGNMCNGIAGMFKWLYDVVFGHSYVPDLCEGIASSFKAIWGIISPVFDFIRSSISNIVAVAQGLGSIVAGILTLDLGKVWEGIKGISSAVISQITNIGKFIFGWLLKLPLKILDVFMAIPSMIGNIFSNIGSYLGSFGGDNVISVMLSQVGNLFSFIGGAISNIVKVAKGLARIITGIVTLDFGMIWDGLNGIGTAISSQFSNFTGYIYDSFKNALSFVFSAMPKLLGWLAGLPMMILNTLLIIPSMIGKMFSNIGSYLSSFGTDGVFSTIMSNCRETICSPIKVATSKM